jgi:hypothetical protein
MPVTLAIAHVYWPLKDARALGTRI